MFSEWYWTLAWVVYYGLVVWVAVRILRSPGRPHAMLAWIVVLLSLPLLGLILFLILGEPRRARHRKRRRRKRLQISSTLDRRAMQLRERSAASRADVEMPGVAELMTFAERVGAFARTRGNDVTVYHDAERTYLDLQLAIESAQSHIHLEYYIFQPDDSGRAFRQLLIDKARSGVECRLLIDYIGCWHIPRSFVEPMREAGVQVAFALPVVPWRGQWRVNYRNHRKIAVIDGAVGFTGSQNIGDEYLGRLKTVPSVRDTHLRFHGPVVHQLQEIFVTDWHYTTKEDLTGDVYFPAQQPCGSHVVQVVPTGPHQRVHVMHQLLFAAMTSARASIRIITPYFVPDYAMILAMQSACYRGTHVELIVPSCTDHRVVLWAGRSSYEELIRAGVQIYEYDEALLHSKVIVVDDSWAMVGSANMDERSFRINYELTTILYGLELSQTLARHFDFVRDKSCHITLQDIHRRSYAETVLLGLARMASPLL
jgi:cardiolipin synthase